MLSFRARTSPWSYENGCGSWKCAIEGEITELLKDLTEKSEE